MNFSIWEQKLNDWKEISKSTFHPRWLPPWNTKSASTLKQPLEVFGCLAWNTTVFYLEKKCFGPNTKLFSMKPKHFWSRKHFPGKLKSCFYVEWYTADDINLVAMEIASWCYIEQEKYKYSPTDLNSNKKIMSRGMGRICLNPDQKQRLYGKQMKAYMWFPIYLQ